MSRLSLSRLPVLPRPRLSYANICSTAALVIALGTGTAYAADTIGSADIIDGEVKNPDLATNAVNTGKIINGGVWAQDVKLGTLTGDHVADGTIGSLDIGDSAVGSTEIIFNAVGESEIGTDAVGQTEIRENSIESDEVVDGSLTGADVANDGLTFSDIAGGGGTGLASFGGLANGRCTEVLLNISGATVGDVVVVTTQADMPDGVFIYGTQVPATNRAKVVLCNMSGATSSPIIDMPLRIRTFH